MFDKLKKLKGSVVKLYPYFTPSCDNYVRTVGFLTAIIVIPTVNFIVPQLFLYKGDKQEDNANNFDIMTAIATVSIISTLSAAQHALSLMLTTSTMQAMKVHNVRLLMDNDSKFLMHGKNKDITSLQYVTVGLGVKHFTESAIPILVSLPMYTITSVSTLINIGLATESLATLEVVCGFVAVSTIAMYVSGKKYYSYLANNQKIDNDLVTKIAFIEAHRTTVGLMNASDTECASVMKVLQEITTNIPALSLFNFANALMPAVATAIASQFLGGYYTNSLIQDTDNANSKILNIMLMSLITNIQNITWILTGNYSYAQLNLEQLQAFERSYNDCLLTSKTHNKMTQKFAGDHLSLLNFCVYKPDLRDTEGMTLITLFDVVTLELLPNKVYKLTGESGHGKTTFLKAITNNWQYTDGVVTLPANAKAGLCFIPQNSFIPTGTLLEILTYPLKPKQFSTTHSEFPFVNDLHLHAMLEVDKENTGAQDHVLFVTNREEYETNINCMAALTHRVKRLLTAVKLLPGIIKESELESEHINWNDRLSGGEKQKIGVIRAILANPKFIIMDEATSALDQANKRIVYEVIKQYITMLQNYTVIYTEHSTTECFADTVLAINGQGLEYHDLM